MGAPCKTVGSAYPGSNPGPATTCVNSPWPGRMPVRGCPCLCGCVRPGVPVCGWLCPIRALGVWRGHGGQGCGVGQRGRRRSALAASAPGTCAPGTALPNWAVLWSRRRLRRRWPGVSARALPWEARPDARRAWHRAGTPISMLIRNACRAGGPSSSAT